MEAHRVMDYDYLAFISYSRKDEAIVKRFHSLLESIKLPKDLIVASDDVRKIVKRRQRFYPVFRDKDELTPGNSLKASLQEKLERSAYLVVMCSPDAARSEWVGKEIAYFRQLGRADRIILVLVRGEHAFASSDNPNAAIHPEAMLSKDDMPLLADLSKAGAGLSRESVRVAASILGIGYGMLFDRLRRRRRRELGLMAMAAMIVIAPLTATLVYQWKQRQLAYERQQQEMVQRQEAVRQQQEAEQAKVLAEAGERESAERARREASLKQREEAEKKLLAAKQYLRSGELIRALREGLDAVETLGPDHAGSQQLLREALHETHRIKHVARIEVEKRRKHGFVAGEAIRRDGTVILAIRDMHGEEQGPDDSIRINVFDRSGRLIQQTEGSTLLSVDLSDSARAYYENDDLKSLEIVEPGEKRSAQGYSEVKTLARQPNHTLVSRGYQKPLVVVNRQDRKSVVVDDKDEPYQGTISSEGDVAVTINRSSKLKLFSKASSGKVPRLIEKDRADLLSTGYDQDSREQAILDIIGFPKNAVAIAQDAIQIFSYDRNALYVSKNSIVRDETASTAKATAGTKPGSLLLLRRAHTGLITDRLIVELDLQSALSGASIGGTANASAWIDDRHFAIDFDTPDGERTKIFDRDLKEIAVIGRDRKLPSCSGGQIALAMPQSAQVFPFSQVLAALGRPCFSGSFMLRSHVSAASNSIFIDSIARSANGERLAVLWSERSSAPFKRTLSLNETKTGSLLASVALPETFEIAGKTFEANYGPVGIDEPGHNITLTRDEIIPNDRAAIGARGVLTWAGLGQPLVNRTEGVEIAATNAAVRPGVVSDGHSFYSFIQDRKAPRIRIGETDIVTGRIKRRLATENIYVCDKLTDAARRIALGVTEDTITVCNFELDQVLGRFIFPNTKIRDVLLAPDKPEAIIITETDVRTVQLPIGHPSVIEQARAELERLQVLLPK